MQGMNTDMVLDFMQNKGPLGLAQIGQLAGQKIQQRREQRQYEELDGQYRQALHTATMNPTEENISALYMIAEPLGRFDHARAAVNDAVARLPVDMGDIDPRLKTPEQIAYEQAYEAWRANPTDEDLRVTLLDAARAYGVYDETESTINQVVTDRNYAADEAEVERLLTEFEANPSTNNYNRVIVASARIGQSEDMRQALDAVIDRMDEADQRRLRAAQEDEFMAAQRAYNENPTPANLDNMMEAGIRIGMYQDVFDYADNLSQREKEQDAQNAAFILAPLSIGDTDAALVQVDNFIEAFSDDPDQVAGLEELRGYIAEGDITGAREFLGVMLGTTAEGRALFEQIHEIDRERRATDITGAQLLSMAYDLEFPNEEQRQRFIEAAEDLPYGMAQQLAEFARLIVPDALDEGEARDRLLQAEARLRQEYEGYVELDNTVLSQLAALESQYDLDNPAGVSDQAFITLYNKVLDPNSVVRESEAARTAAATGVFRNVDDIFVGWFAEGGTLDIEARRDIIEAARAIGEAAKDHRDTYRNLLNNSVEFLDPDQQHGSVDRVFRSPPDHEANARALFDAMQAIANSSSVPEEIMSEFRAADITTMEELEEYVNGTTYQSVLERIRRENGTGATATTDSGIDYEVID
jgi:hypothetical protein